MFQMLRQGKGIKSITISLFDANGWPYMTVRKHRMRMKISAEDSASVRRVREVHSPFCAMIIVNPVLRLCVACRPYRGFGRSIWVQKQHGNRKVG
jgi:hypothetical protein